MRIGINTLKSREFVSREILIWMSENKGRSFVRMGDGEGMVLSRPTPNDEVLWTHMLTHFGPGLNETRVNWLADKLNEALIGADIVGLREDNLGFQFDENLFCLPPKQFTKIFRTTFPLRAAEHNIKHPAALRLAITSKHISELQFNNTTTFTSAWMHFLLSESGFLVQLLCESFNTRISQ